MRVSANGVLSLSLSLSLSPLLSVFIVKLGINHSERINPI
jgi:hypothetical protein